MTAPTPDTPQQAKVRTQYEAACRELAEASVALQLARQHYNAASRRFEQAYGAAKAVGIA